MILKGNFILILLGIIANVACSQQHSFNQPLIPGEDLLIGGTKFETFEGFVDVPENYQIANSTRIQIPVLVVKSSNKNPQEPIFWFDGGPGGTNIVAHSKIDLPSAANALKNHDFVCVGYRGVDGPVKLESNEITKAFKGLRNRMLSEESIQNIKDKIDEYKVSLTKQNIDINNYNILNVIEDVETVRTKLGYSKINILSFSYGTRIALLYSYKYPEVISRTLMIGATPPGYFLARAEQAEEVIKNYDLIHKEQTKTDYSILETMKRAFETLPRRWSIFKLDADKIKAGTLNALYTVDFAVSVFDAYSKAAYENDYSGLFILQKLSDVSHPKVIGDVYAKTVSADWKDDFDYENELRNSQTILGGNVSLLYASTAREWDIRPIPSAYQQFQHSDTETLIISGSLDHRTPPSIVDRELMPYLNNGKHIIMKNCSHTDILSVVMKDETLIGDYFIDGKIDAEAIKVSEKVDFTPKVKMSKAKIFLFGLLK